MIGDRRGAALVEFALAAPLILALVAGIIGYGGWLLTAQAVQQAANEAARATIAGLDAAERRQIATDTAARAFTGGPLDPQRASVAVTEASETVTVRVGYDLANSPILAFGLIPMPPAAMSRSATVRLDPA